MRFGRFASIGLVLAAFYPFGNTLAGESSKPRLVVVVSIDQLPFEYLLRMRRGFAEDGFFNAAFRDGAVFRACHHGQAFTITGPGHSVLLSGAYPATTGIIENDWFDRATGKTVYCVDDRGVEVVGGPGQKPMSPKNLAVGTVGDSLKLASNGRSKVIGVSLKDRAAILMTGHMADGAYWFDADSGLWITSTYYRKALPDYLQAYNSTGQAKQYGGRTWELLLPSEQYEHYYPDNAPFETNVAALGRAFPHPLPKGDDKQYLKSMTTSPFGNEMTLAVAELLAAEEKLGTDDDTDLLCINLSSNDYIGHAYGPYSLEAQDITYRTDRLLASLVQFLDRTVGQGRWTLGLSSDHGVAPVPEHALQLKLPARRVPEEHFQKLRDRIEQVLVERFDKPDESFRYVRYLDANSVYLDRSRRYAEAQRIARDLVLEDEVVAAAFTRDELLAGGNATELFERFRLSFHPRRSGDVLFCLEPYHIAGKTTATHGSPWEYDTHVPLIMLGCGVRPGVFDRPVSPPMLAPTIARLTGVDAPSGCTVEPLYEVLGER